MSITKNLGRSATRSNPADSSPAGLGVSKVPSLSQRSSQESSIRCASAGVYRCGGTPPGSFPGSLAGWLAVWLIVGAPGFAGAFRAEKNPSRRRGRRADWGELVQHGRRRRRPDTQPCYLPHPSHPGGWDTPVLVNILLRTTDHRPVEFVRKAGRRLVPSSRACALATVAAVAVFATGVGPRPDGAFWDPFYDLALYNLIYLAAAAVCVHAARRGAAERVAWLAMAFSMLLQVAGNALWTLVYQPMADPPFPSAADGFYLAYYVPLYIALVQLIRARVVRFHPSMWLDGLIGALGAAAVAAALLLAPALQLTDGDAATVVTNLAYPVADVVLLALLVGVTAVLGVRRDRTLVLLGLGIAATLLGDIVYLDLASSGSYVEGGPLDLTWLVAMALVAVAAHLSRPGRVADRERQSRTGWRVLAVPLVCNLASLGILGAGFGDDMPRPAAWCAVGCVLAALARTAVTFREVRGFNEVKEQALTDELTGLPNRRALFARAGQVLEAATARRPAALLLLDLDGFKEVNDGLGHHAGDHLLRQIGPRLSGGLRPDDLLARLGGDEFAVLLPDTGLDDAVAIAEELRALLGQPFSVEGIRLHVGVSIGVSTAPVPAADVEELLRCADVAMYAAKNGREGVHAYVPDPRSGTTDRLRTMEELRVALAEGQLVVHLQPQVALPDGRVVGAEALVRWQHPARGLLSPADLLPAAEQAGSAAAAHRHRPGARAHRCGGLVAAPGGVGLGQPLGGERDRPRPAGEGDRRTGARTGCRRPR